MKRIRLLVVDDHLLFRQGIKALLDATSEFSVVGEAEDGRSAVAAFNKLQPDLVLMDLSLPVMDGSRAIREIKRDFPDAKIVALSVHNEEEYVLEAFVAGAEGYTLKEASNDELLTALRTVHAGKPFISPGISRHVIAGFVNGRGANGASAANSLSNREREVYELSRLGLRNKDIAAKLNISIKTVEKHKTNILRKQRGAGHESGHLPGHQLRH